MKRSAWSVLCIVLAASALTHARMMEGEDGNALGGERPSGPGSGPRRAAPVPNGPATTPAAPAASPRNPMPPGSPTTPRFGVPRNGAQPDQSGGRAPDPSQGHWSTQRPGQSGGNGNWNGRGEYRGEPQPRSSDNRRDYGSRGYATPYRAYQWRDYDRYRTQHFRYDGGRYYGLTRYHVNSYLWPRGYGARLWFIGEWLPSAFYLDNRYVLDYWRYGLYEPPAGCHWLRVGNDALLVDNFSGEVLDVIYSLFW